MHPVHGNPQTGLLRAFWEPDRVLGSPLRGLRIQGSLNCPTRRVFLCALRTETPEQAFQEPSASQTWFLEARSGVCVFGRVHTKGLMQQHASSKGFLEGS